MSESTQTSQAALCDVRRCSCVVFPLKPLRKDLKKRHKSPPPPPPHCAPKWGRGGWACFSSPFSLLLGEKTTQEHLFTSHRSACEVWVDSDILENFSQMALTQLLPGAFQLQYFNTTKSSCAFLCGIVRFLINCAKSHHCTMSDGLLTNVGSI